VRSKGIPVFDTTDGRFRVWYFEVQDDSGLDQYEEVLSCVQRLGIDNCTEYAILWVDEELSSL
jgi:hypothetical protein